MNLAAQIISPFFAEVFNIRIDGESLDISLVEIESSPLSNSRILTLDLTRNITEILASFPFNKNDLFIDQIEDLFLIGIKDDEINWYKVDAQKIINYCLEYSSFTNEIKKFGEDENLLINSVFSDLLRNDYSVSDFNKKVKYMKLSLILSYISSFLPVKAGRLIVDENFLGDIEIEDLGYSFKNFSCSKYFEVVKLDGIWKTLVLLEKEGVINRTIEFKPTLTFVNNFYDGKKYRIFFTSTDKKIDYIIDSNHNYVFDLEGEEIELDIQNDFKSNVNSLITFYNNDEREVFYTNLN